jgi:hypothetical protein
MGGGWLAKDDDAEHHGDDRQQVGDGRGGVGPSSVMSR